MFVWEIKTLSLNLTQCFCVFFLGPHMGPNYPQPAAQPMGPTAEPLFPVEPNPLGPQPPYPTQHPYSSPSGYLPQSKNSSTPYPAAPGGPPYPTAAAGPPYPPAGGCPYPVGPPMSKYDCLLCSCCCCCNLELLLFLK